MKYFIDFEATQFSMEIISVGSVREDGQTFYALVAPKEGKITPFITTLTGITAEMVKTAMTPDSVFSQFYDWVFKNPNDIPEFIVWGDSDTDFAKHTCHHTETLKAKMVLGYICGNTKDYAKACKKNLKWATNHSLINTLKRFNPSAEQNHNSLDDAVLLKELYNFIENTPREILDEKFTDWKKTPNNPAFNSASPQPKWDCAGYPVGTICIIDSHKIATYTFQDIESAALWIKENKCKKDNYDNFDLEQTMRKLNKAINCNKAYYGMKWRKVRV